MARPRQTFDEYLEKPLPNSPEAERLCLGAVFMNNALAFELFAHLEPNDFYSPVHCTIARAIKSVMGKGMAIDPILVNEEIKLAGETESVQSISVITNLYTGIPAYTTIKPHIDIIRKAAVARKLIKFCNDRASRLLEQESDPEQIMSSMATDLISMQYDDPSAGDSLIQVAVHVREIFQQWEAGVTSGSSIPTGIPELDGKLRLKGLARGDLTLIGARPSMGKTALLIQIAANAARMGIPVLFISLEMPKHRILMRMLPPMTGISNKSINPWMFQNADSAGERYRIYEALSRLNMPIYFDNSIQMTRLVARAQHMIETKGIQLVIFDYLTMIQGGNENYDRTGAVGDIVNGMKDLGVRNNVAMLGAAQFKRGIDKEYRRPRMDEFRDSGVIEQAVDVILFPWDENAKKHSAEPELIKDSMWLDLYCEKQRDGERYWTIPLHFDKELQIFKSEEMGAGKPPPKPEEDRIGAALAMQAGEDFHNKTP